MNVESLFKFPWLYDLKLQIVLRVNNMYSLSLDRYIKDKRILDVGCGLKQYFYDVKKTKSRIAMDNSAEMVERGKKLYPDDLYLVGSAHDLHLYDNTVDVTLLLAVLHHMDRSQWEQAVSEALRVSKEYIIILDHVKNDNPLKAFIQQVWWNLVDGGRFYAKMSDWSWLLRKYFIEETEVRGRFWKNIVVFKISRGINEN